MRKTLLITWVGIFALFLGGCQIGGNEQASQSSPSPQPVAPKPQQPGASPKASPFGNPPVVAQKQGTPTAVQGLIQPTLPDTVKPPQGQRSDPFSAVPVQPEVTVSPNPASPGGSPRVVPPVTQLPPVTPNTPNRGASGNRPAQPQPGAKGSSQPSRFKLPQLPKSGSKSNVLPRRTPSKPSTTIASKPPKPSTGGSNPTNPNASSSPTSGSVATAPRAIPELPKLPEPTQAKGVEVTGVVEVGGVSMAIVKVPNEPDRYVRQGQRIANGQVLVKRIEMNRGPEPVVILEQYGVEIAKSVGEAPSTSPGGPGQPPPPPTAFAPSKPSLNTSVSDPA